MSMPRGYAVRLYLRQEREIETLSKEQCKPHVIPCMPALQRLHRVGRVVIPEQGLRGGRWLT